MVLADVKSDLKQLWLLLWKNVNLQKRSLVGLFLELMLPAFFAIILLPIRSIVKSDKVLNDTSYEPFHFDTLPPIGDKFDPWSLGYSPNNDTLVNSIMNKTGQALQLDIQCNSFSLSILNLFY